MTKNSGSNRFQYSPQILENRYRVARLEVDRFCSKNTKLIFASPIRIESYSILANHREIISKKLYFFNPGTPEGSFLVKVQSLVN